MTMTKYENPEVLVWGLTDPGVLLEFFDENCDEIQFVLNPAKAKTVAYKILAVLAYDEELRGPKE